MERTDSFTLAISQWKKVCTNWTSCMEPLKSLMRMAPYFFPRNITWASGMESLYFMKRARKKLNLNFMEAYRMNKIHFVVFIFLGSLQAAFAQESDLLKLYKQKFPDAPAAFVERSEQLSILVKDDSLEIFGDVVEDMLHLKPQTDAYSSGRVYGSHFSQVKDLKAKTLIWEKNKFKEMHVTNFKKNQDQREGTIRRA